MRAVRAEQAAGHRAGIGRQQAAGHACECGLSASVVAQQAGPTTGKRDGYRIQNGVVRRGVRVGHAVQCELHTDIPSLFKLEVKRCVEVDV